MHSVPFLPMLDWFGEGGRGFIVFPWAPMDLKQAIALPGIHPLSRRQLATMVSQLASAIHRLCFRHAMVASTDGSTDLHLLGIIHGDVKPENVMMGSCDTIAVVRDGVERVSDWCIRLERIVWLVE